MRVARVKQVTAKIVVMTPMSSMTKTFDVKLIWMHLILNKYSGGDTVDYTIYNLIILGRGGVGKVEDTNIPKLSNDFVDPPSNSERGKTPLSQVDNPVN